MAEKLIVIGGTAAGLSAASRARKEKPDMEIQVFEKSGYVSYGACGLPYFVGGVIHDVNDLVAINAEALKNRRNISTWIHHEVIRIDPKKKEISVINLDTDKISTHLYDKLVIATGAVPVIPSIPGISSDGVYYLRNMEDGISLKAAIKENRRVCIIGGGAIGLETAEELSHAGLSVSIHEQFPRLLPFLDKAFSAALEDTMIKHGIKVHTDSQISEILSENGKVTGVRTVHGENEPADIILVSAGVKPASNLAEKAGLALGLKGGIAVDDELRTSQKDIWACGDCVQMKNRLTGRPAYVPLGTTANKQGRIAGSNAAGGHDTFKGILGSMVTKVFEYYIAATGLSKDQAAEEGYEAVSVSITKTDRASYYPGGRDNHICLIVDKKTGRLLGAQGIGSESIAGRMNVFATAITCGMTVREINELDLVYAPPAAPVYDPILIAASQAIKEITK